LIHETTEWSDLVRPEIKLFKDAMKNKMETKSNQAQYKLLELYANRILQSIESCQNAFEEKSVKEYLDGEQAKASTNFGIL